MLPRDLAPGVVLDYARRAERLGFDELWVVEDLGFRGGVAQTGAVLAATDTIRVGIGILPAAVRNVAFAAMEIATLAQLFPGRVDVGIGHGMPGWLRAVGAWPERPVAYLGAYVTALRSLLEGETVRSDGLVTLDDISLDPTARPDVVPDILLGVRGPKSLALSGRVADGTVLAEPATPEYVRAALHQIAAERPHRMAVYNVAVVADDDASALRAVRPGLAWIGEPDWAPHIQPLEFAAEFADLRARSATREAFADRMPDAWVSQLALAGTPETVRARTGELFAAGVTSSVMLPIGADPVAALESLSRALPNSSPQMP
jgi:alkanesulfonate monooxygenase SsuD/methylene tetrahydromethanopterin reductase-like flavin-dependent oxidoreductase (luciferase family)